jgi:hypothetical protein
MDGKEFGWLVNLRNDYFERAKVAAVQSEALESSKTPGL